MTFRKRWKSSNPCGKGITRIGGYPNSAGIFGKREGIDVWLVLEFLAQEKYIIPLVSPHSQFSNDLAEWRKKVQALV